jgi:acyl carrier protein
MLNYKMETGEILKEIQEIFREVFRNPALTLTETSAPADIHEWDSLTHVLLLSKIEKKFGIKFSLDDMLSFENTGDICKAVMRKTE